MENLRCETYLTVILQNKKGEKKNLNTAVFYIFLFFFFAG